MALTALQTTNGEIHIFQEKTPGGDVVEWVNDGKTSPYPWSKYDLGTAVPPAEQGV